jgi:hypothetical protein
MGKNNIFTVRAFERFLPVMTTAEQRRIACGVVPTVAELDNWAARLEQRDRRLDSVFARAYNNQRVWNRKKTIPLQ